MTESTERLKAALADRYRVERELGQGGMATVYLAQDLKHHRPVAIKVMRPEVTAELAADRFLLEIRTTANLQHPHILPLFDSGTIAVESSDLRLTTQLYYVMPFIEGESLRDRLDRDGPLPVDDAVRLVCEVAGALDYAHQQGILHRDLKPENILISRGHALLADFGIARATGSTGRERLTQTGLAIGTPTYMSPEQATGEAELTPASDVYGLATILYELLTGDPPFTGATFEAILVKRFTQEAPRLRARRADAPMSCDTAVGRALARDPAARFASASEFAAALAPVAVPPGDAARNQHVTSLAVLPFENLSPDAENGYFSDGLTEEVITTLSKVGTLRVISRSTMMQFRDRTRSAGDVARTLGVTHVLEGSVRKAGDRLRISASLLAAGSDASLWAERFDGLLADVFDIQDRVAAAVVSALEIVLTPEELRKLAEHPLENAEAYDHYLRARQALNDFSMSGTERAFGYLNEALALAPDNVVLLRGLGIACYAAANTGERPDRQELLARALDYAEAIERLQPSSPYSAEIRGLVALLQGNQEESLRQLGRAFELLPADVDVAVWYSLIVAYAGHFAVAAAISRAILRVAPDHSLGWGGEFFGLLLAGKHLEAVGRLSRIPATVPATFAVLLTGLAYVAEGDHARALDSLDRAAPLEPDAFKVISCFLAQALRGEPAAARAELVPEVAAGIWMDFQYAEWVAQGFALLGEVDEAARWLEQSVELGCGIHETITRHNAAWRPWLEHPKFVPILASLKQNAERYAQLGVAPRALAMGT
ncbi:MAG: protein kinase [Gemmatimonadales bacterium]|nr:protein kinase [Gemmatimonadales bacterium]